MTINNPYRDNEIMVEPLTYLTLMLVQNQEQTSNAAGYIDASKKCVKLKKKEIKAGFKSDCDTETYVKPAVQTNQPTVETYDEWIKNNPELAGQNETLKKEVDKAGGWKNFWNNFSTWSKTEQGAGILNTVGMLAGGLMGNQQTPEADLPKGYPTPQQSTGMNPIWWVLIGIGGLALLGGLAFGIYKLSVKKSVQTV
jgi:hypothetical protein